MQPPLATHSGTLDDGAWDLCSVGRTLVCLPSAPSSPLKRREQKQIYAITDCDSVDDLLELAEQGDAWIRLEDQFEKLIAKLNQIWEFIVRKSVTDLLEKIDNDRVEQVDRNYRLRKFADDATRGQTRDA
jgi:hypothetical protein